MQVCLTAWRRLPLQCPSWAVLMTSSPFKLFQSIFMDLFKWWWCGGWSFTSKICRQIQMYSKRLYPAAAFSGVKLWIYTAGMGILSIKPHSDMGAIFLANGTNVSRWLSFLTMDCSSCLIRSQGHYSTSTSQAPILMIADGSICVVVSWVKNSPVDRSSQDKPTGWEADVRTIDVHCLHRPDSLLWFPTKNCPYKQPVWSCFELDS